MVYEPIHLAGYFFREIIDLVEHVIINVALIAGNVQMGSDFTGLPFRPSEKVDEKRASPAFEPLRAPMPTSLHLTTVGAVGRGSTLGVPH